MIREALPMNTWAVKIARSKDSYQLLYLSFSNSSSRKNSNIVLVLPPLPFLCCIASLPVKNKWIQQDQISLSLLSIKLLLNSYYLQNVPCAISKLWVPVTQVQVRMKIIENMICSLSLGMRGDWGVFPEGDQMSQWGYKNYNGYWCSGRS